MLIEAVDDPAQAVRVAERITEELRRPFIMEGRDLYVIASIGISLGDARTHDPDDLLREADTAMYRVKDEGGDFRVFNPAMYERAFSAIGGGERPQESHRARGVRHPLPAHGRSADRRAVGYGSPGEVGPPGAGTPGAFGVRARRRGERPGDTDGGTDLAGGLFQGQGVARGKPPHPFASDVREPLCLAALPLGPSRYRREGTRGDRVGGELPYTGHYGDSLRQRCWQATWRSSTA